MSGEKTLAKVFGGGWTRKGDVAPPEITGCYLRNRELFGQTGLIQYSYKEVFNHGTTNTCIINSL